MLSFIINFSCNAVASKAPRTGTRTIISTVPQEKLAAEKPVEFLSPAANLSQM